MKKVVYESRLAKWFLRGCSTITIGPFVLTKYTKERMPQDVRNHECTHTRQWIELACASGLILFGLMVWLDLSVWWILLAGVTFYVWYVVEWLVRLAVYAVKRNGKNAYRMISFEQEAYAHEDDNNYLENCSYFSGWMKCLIT